MALGHLDLPELLGGVEVLTRRPLGGDVVRPGRADARVRVPVLGAELVVARRRVREREFELAVLVGGRVLRVFERLPVRLPHLDGRLDLLSGLRARPLDGRARHAFERLDEVVTQCADERLTERRLEVDAEPLGKDLRLLCVRRPSGGLRGVNQPVVFERVDAFAGHAHDAADLRRAVLLHVRPGGREVVEPLDRLSLAREDFDVDLFAGLGLRGLWLPVQHDRLRFDRTPVVLVEPDHLALVVALRPRLEAQSEPTLLAVLTLNPLVEHLVEVADRLVAAVEGDGRVELGVRRRHLPVDHHVAGLVALVALAREDVGRLLLVRREQVVGRLARVLLERVGVRDALGAGGDPVAVVPPRLDAVRAVGVVEVAVRRSFVGVVRVHRVVRTLEFARLGRLVVHPLEALVPLDDAARLAGVAGGPDRRGDADERDEEDGEHRGDGQHLPALDVADCVERGELQGVERDLEEVRRPDRDDDGEVVIEPSLCERRAPDERRPHDEVQFLGVVLDEERRADEERRCDDESDHLPAHADDTADRVVGLRDRVDGADHGERGRDVQRVVGVVGAVQRPREDVENRRECEEEGEPVLREHEVREGGVLEGWASFTDGPEGGAGAEPDEVQ